MPATTVTVQSFEGFPSETFRWFAGLEADNSKRYFTANRDTYDRAVRGALEVMLEDFADELGGRVRMFRQHRDIRFSADKSPYKTATYGIVHAPGWPAALYAAVSARGLYAGTGYWRMARDQLERYRAAVIEDGTGEALAGAVSAVEREGLELGSPALKTAPRGMPRDHPRVALLRYKSLIAGRRLLPGPPLATRTAFDHVASTWRDAEPLTSWLNSHVGPSTLPPDEGRWRGRRR
jgi:uncharacterized protein (TIGR02453 family)